MLNVAHRAETSQTDSQKSPGICRVPLKKCQFSSSESESNHIIKYKIQPLTVLPVSLPASSLRLRVVVYCDDSN